MLGIALKIAFGWGKSLMAMIGAGLRWLFAEWYRPVIAALAILVIFLWLSLGDMTKQRDDEHAALVDEQKAHATTVQFYTDAAIIAEQRAKENAARVTAEYAAAAKGASDENARLRADFDRRLAGFLRARPATAAANPGGAEATDLPGSTALPAGPMPDAGTALVPVTDLERCAAAYAQLIALIGYVQTTAAVDTAPVESQP